MKVLEQEIINAKPIIDEIIALTDEMSWRYPKIAYYRTNKVTLVYKEYNLRKFKELESLIKKYPNISVKYPEMIIIDGATSPNHLQKFIIYALTGFNFANYKHINITSDKKYIEITKEIYNETSKNKEIIERAFKKTETAETILFDLLGDSMFTEQQKFIA